MQKAAKEKSSLLWLIALGMLTCAPSYASSTRDLPPENRAEIFLRDAQNRIEPPALSPTTAASYYDSTSAVASGSSVAPKSVGEFKLTDTIANHLDDVVKRGPFKGEPARPFLNSPLAIREIMAGGKGVPDPGGFPGALRWDVPGTFRGSSGTWELVVDPKTNTILHFNFVGGG